MKHRLFLIISSCLLLLRTQAQTELLTLAENDLKGSVRSATIKAHWMKEMFGELEPQSFYFSESCSFSKEGLLTESVREENFDYKKEYSFKYDKSNKLIFKRSEFGKAKEKKHYTWKPVYDQQGREIELNMYDEKDKLNSKHKIKYRDDGQPLSSVYYNGDGDVSTRLEYVYNSQHQLISTTSYNRDDKVFRKKTAEYDETGNKIKEEIKEFAGKYGTDVSYSWKYANGKKLSEFKTTVNDNKVKKYSLEFDQWGNVIREVTASGTVITTEYTFDSNNNWITATSSWKGFDGPAVYRKVREIRYY
ncbi:MAG: hypothetical protein ABW007_01850 [Chitinophagaceae bacterium]